VTISDALPTRKPTLKEVRLREQFNLAQRLYSQENYSDSAKVCAKILMSTPAEFNVLLLQGVSLYKSNQFDDSLLILSKCIGLNPKSAEAYFHLGAVNTLLTKNNEALDNYTAAIAINPSYLEAVVELAKLYFDTGKLQLAETTCNKALTIDPHCLECLNILGLINSSKNTEVAKSFFTKAVNHNLHYAPARYHLSKLQIQTGEYAAGWENFEHRFASGFADYHNIALRHWNGLTPLDGKTVYVCADSTLADTILLSRFLPLLQTTFGVDKVIFSCPAPLVKLLGKSMPTVKVVEDVYPPKNIPPFDSFDAFLPLGSLPRAFKTSIYTVPPTPYLYTNLSLPNLPTETAGIIHTYQKLNIGVCLSGLESQQRIDALSLLKLSKIKSFEITDLSVYSTNFVEVCDDYYKLAAVLQQFACVATSDNVVAHLAGSLGVPTLLLNSKPCNFIWLEGQDYSPWYSSMRVINQTNKWSSVVKQAKYLLADFVKGKRFLNPPKNMWKDPAILD